MPTTVTAGVINTYKLILISNMYKCDARVFYYCGLQTTQVCFFDETKFVNFRKIPVYTGQIYFMDLLQNSKLSSHCKVEIHSVAFLQALIVRNKSLQFM